MDELEEKWFHSVSKGFFGSYCDGTIYKNNILNNVNDAETGLLTLQ